ncbi:hypothetical protein HMSSN036_74040 [Paenibacillus macerans]|nr:hypothetical protein HMSSN036_74040 [Paenibacillus macerans]
MPVTLTFPYSQAAGVGRGYFVAADAPGAAGIVTVASTTGDVELRITRYNAPDLSPPSLPVRRFGKHRQHPNDRYLALQTATGTLSLITNV